MTYVKSKTGHFLIGECRLRSALRGAYLQGHLYGESSWSADFQSYLNDDWGIGIRYSNALAKKARAQRGY